MWNLNPTPQDIESGLRHTEFAQGLTDAARESYVRDLSVLRSKLPSPPKAALMCAGLGAAVAIVAGRSMFKYAFVLGGLGFAAASLFDVTLASGYTMGFQAAMGKAT